MYIVTAATGFELEAFAGRWPGAATVKTFRTGIGPVETATRLTRYLAGFGQHITAIINIGVGGAYQLSATTETGSRQPVILDLCLAEKEVLGDLGICFDDRIEPLNSGTLEVCTSFDLDRELIQSTQKILGANGFPTCLGTFVTVNGVSATAKRGAMLAGMYNGLCENMEGAAVARVCEEFSIPLLELRCISNMVEDRNRKNWKLREAALRCGAAAALVVGGLSA